MYKVGNLTFPSKEYYYQLLKTNLIKEQDCSPEMREKHDEEMRKRREEKL